MKQRLTMKKSMEVTVEEAYRLFEKKAKVRNLSEYTLKTYGYHFDAFVRCIDKSRLISSIRETDIDNFIMYLRNECGVKPVTVNSYLRTIRGFLYDCMERKYLKRFRISLVHAEKEIKETYTADELIRLLKKPDLSKCRFSEYRAWVFENYLLGTGNRISSALNLQIKDIDFGEGVLLIRKSKNRKQQIIPLSNTLGNILREYLEIRGGEPEDYVFCNDYGEKGSRRSYQQLVQEYNLRRSVSKTSCHLFRHTFAKQWILAGGDIFRLQKILGHYDLEMTKEYLQMFGQELQMDFEKYNPLEQIQKNSHLIRM